MAETSSPLFLQYEQEYATKSTEASRKLEALGPLRGGEPCVRLHAMPFWACVEVRGTKERAAGRQTRCCALWNHCRATARADQGGGGGPAGGGADCAW